MKYYRVSHCKAGVGSYPSVIVEAESPEGAVTVYRKDGKTPEVCAGEELVVYVVESGGPAFYFSAVLTNSGIKIISREDIRKQNAT